MNRRDFIKSGTVAASAMTMPGLFAEGAQRRVRMGFIGVGNRGTQLMHIFMKNPLVEVTALADVYEPYLHRDDSAYDPNFAKWGLGGRVPSFHAKDGSLKPQEAVLAERIKSGKCVL